MDEKFNDDSYGLSNTNTQAPTLMSYDNDSKKLVNYIFEILILMPFKINNDSNLLDNSSN